MQASLIPSSFGCPSTVVKTRSCGVGKPVVMKTHCGTTSMRSCRAGCHANTNFHMPRPGLFHNNNVVVLAVGLKHKA